MRALTIASTVAAVMLLGACGSGSEDEMGLEGTTWMASSITGDAVSGAEITAVFSGGKIAGSAGCNRYSGPYEISGTSISFPRAFMSTLMACEEQVMAQEHRYLEALATAERLEQADGALTLFDADDAAVVSYIEVSQDLDGTSWALLSHLDGDSRVTMLAGTEASLSFQGSQVSGSAGCNSFTGTYESSGASLTVDELEMTEMGCVEPDGIMEQETAVAEALRSAAEYRIDGRILTLWNADGLVAMELERR